MKASATLSILPPDQFSGLIRSNHIPVLHLAARWGVSDRRIRQIVSDPERPAYYDDALRFAVTNMTASELPCPRAQLSSAEFCAAVVSKGWTPKLLASRWGLSGRRVYQMTTGNRRPLYLDDAVLFLPDISMSQCDIECDHASYRPPVAQQIESLSRRGWTAERLAIRWGMPAGSVNALLYNPNRSVSVDDATSLLAPYFDGAKQVRLDGPEIRRLLADKGWKPSTLALRWNLSSRRINQLVSDLDRPAIYNDAFANLPRFGESSGTLAPEAAQPCPTAACGASDAYTIDISN